MTRYARSGSTQKHKKVPGTATPWSEFAKRKANLPMKSKGQSNPIETKSNINMQKQKSSFQQNVSPKKNKKKYKFVRKQNKEQDVNINMDEEKTSFQQNVLNKKKNKFGKQHKVLDLDINMDKQKSSFQQTVSTKMNKKNKFCKEINKDNSDTDISITKFSFQPNISVKKKFMLVKEQNSEQNLDISMDEEKSSIQLNVSAKKNKKSFSKHHNKEKNSKVSDDDHSESAVVSSSGNKVFKKKHMVVKQKNNPQPLNISMNIERSSIQQTVSAKKNTKKSFAKQNSKESDDGHSKGVIVSSYENKVFEKKKSRYMEKLMKKRIDQNIPLLPSKVERRLYNLKKSLRANRVPISVLKEIIRKERRKEEVKFRKEFNPSKQCYNCRKIGHILADCPEKSNASGPSNLETGICFKCGSVDHTSSKCHNKVQGFPFAKCFICKEQGHISKDCPSNTRGVYIKGGQCNLCGNVNHLRKDCPSLKIKKKEESSITLHTIRDVTSLDEEIIEKKHVKKQNVKKSPKVVKF